MTKYNYYHVDCGHFPAQIKLCFDNAEFQKILADHDIKIKATALDEGVAETHYLTDGREGIIIMIFDLEECDEGPAQMAGVIAHEATHCVCRVFEHIGEEPEEIGEESRAYLTEHIVKQLTQAVIVEKEKRARERDRKVPTKKGKGKRGSVPEVDIDDNGRAGSNSDVEQTHLPSRVEDSNGNIVSPSADSFQRSGGAGVSSNSGTK